MNQPYVITGQRVSLDDIKTIWSTDVTITLSDEAKQNITKCRTFLEQKIASSELPIYGVNTGFGSLCNVLVSEDKLDQLQHQLLVSHAAGIGDIIEPRLAKHMLFLKILAFSKGYSGVRLSLVERMITLYNASVIPIIYSIGSLGASGDLAPLAHMSLPLIGKGEVFYNGAIQPCHEVLASLGLQPIALAAKEGLALLNGTQFSLAHGLEAIIKGEQLLTAANSISAMSCDAYNVQLSPFHPLIQKVRNHKGQEYVGEQMTTYLSGSQILSLPKYNVQDPYSFRCIPQVHGASKLILDSAKDTFINEVNSVTDNPTIFPDDDIILSGGNFHAQTIALTLENLGIALSELANIAERRIYNLINGDRDLPPFLTAEPGVQSGFMIGQYTAAALVNQTKHLANPVSTDSITSSMGQEDHVSMAANAGTKTIKIVANVARVLGVELLCACQALDFRKPMLPSPKNLAIYNAFRSKVTHMTEDRVLSVDMHAAESFIWNDLGI